MPSDMVYVWLLRQDRVLEVSGIPSVHCLATALKTIGKTGIAKSVQKNLTTSGIKLNYTVCVSIIKAAHILSVTIV